jgi:formylglycine-generating enzyme required for sulfatase activity/nitrate/TMAO reductase-like tetraheme cytochrome c subunit
MTFKAKQLRWILFMSGMLLASLLIFSGNVAVKKTSADAFCAACHIHPQATQSWKRSTHVDNQRGIKVHCVECHLPPQGEGYLVEKVKTGARDVWGKLFKDPETLDWEARSQVDYAKGHTFESSCIACHVNNFPIGLSEAGREAHLYYEGHREELHCINCHITVGHYDPGRIHARNVEFGLTSDEAVDIYTEPAFVEGLVDFTEYIPGTSVSFEMKAIPGGTFTMGSPEDEPLREAREGPLRDVSVSSFYLGKFEVSWDEYLAFFKQTGVQGKTSDAYLNLPVTGVDAISGPTPPWGAPDQGWGQGERPAITMTHHAATVYCQWLSNVTGKKYRLPTEAEWEYAARGGTTGAYFFDGDPKRYSGTGLRNRIFGVDTSVINSYVVYRENSRSRTRLPEKLGENPLGLVNMLGNVAEFCRDWYAEDAYEKYPEGVLKDPAGPPSGTEYVIRGGSFRDAAEGVRCASRDHTRTDVWLSTDPQIPKSIWWYSDCTFVGFRVLCEYEEKN